MSRSLQLAGTAGLVASVTLALVHSPLLSQVAVGQEPAEAVRQDAKAASFGLPGPVKQHQHVQRDVGEWTATARFWVAAGTQPMESQATEVVTPLGEFWVSSEFKGDLAGMPFTGRGQYGYDPVLKKFVGTWIDSTSPHLTSMQGDIEAETGKLVMMATAIDAQTGKPTKMKNVSWHTEDGGRVFEMYMPNPGDDGGWWRMMEITYSR